MATPQGSLTRIQIWLMAARPRTLPAASAPVIVGAALAFYDGAFQVVPALAALLGGLLLQIGANIANDVFDYKKGADTKDRLGPPRVTQMGLLAPRQVLLGMWITFALATLVGIYLVSLGGWPILAIGLLSIISAIAYTGGPFPLGYKGLGDLFVFIFFGLAAVLGTYYVQALTISTLAIWASVPMGLLITAILVVNNLRDIDTDRASGKKTLAVRFGIKFTRIEYLLLLIVSYAIPLLLVFTVQAPLWLLLTWLTIPFAVPLLRLMFTQHGRILNQALAGTARLVLYYAILFAVGLIISRT